MSGKDIITQQNNIVAKAMLFYEVKRTNQELKLEKGAELG